jgi:hypothetical protein
MWVLYNYVTSLGIYLVLRVVPGGNVSLTDRTGHGQDGGDQPPQCDDLERPTAVSVVGRDDARIAKKASPFLIPVSRLAKL